MTPEIEQEAADWIARRYAGLSALEERELAAWRAADPRHAAAWAELDATWRLLDRVRTAAPPVVADDIPGPSVAKRRWRRFVPALATAAALAIGYLGWWRPAPQETLRFADEAATAVGSFQKLTLPDGSVVRLNTDSRVEVRYAEHERRVRLLRGEAHFSVAGQPARPFFVEAGGVAVRAVGTAFNVRLNAEAIEVLVTEGKVQVDDVVRGGTVLAPRAPVGIPLLVAGERAVIPAPADAPQSVSAVLVSLAEIERSLAWRDRRLEFVAVPLGEIVAEFNRYNRMRLVIEDVELASRRFGGSFRADEPETFVRLLQTRFGLSVERRGSDTVLQP